MGKSRTRKCIECGEKKTLNKFVFRNKAKGWLSSYCKPCEKIIGRRSYQKLKQRREDFNPVCLKHLSTKWVSL